MWLLVCAVVRNKLLEPVLQLEPFYTVSEILKQSSAVLLPELEYCSHKPQPSHVQGEESLVTQALATSRHWFDDSDLNLSCSTSRA